MGKCVAIVQSNYIPWKGYFDLINMVDEFILFDDVQYTKRDWRNRNKLKTPIGPQWLTIPVITKGKQAQPIRDVKVADSRWSDLHWKTIVQNYATAAYFAEYQQYFQELYLDCPEVYLSEINHYFLMAICQLLQLNTTVSWSMEYQLTDGKSERLISLCKQANATDYISGPSAKSYLNEEQFEANGIQVSYINYTGYAEYNQLYPPFDHNVSIIDLILNEGPYARSYLKSL